MAATLLGLLLALAASPAHGSHFGAPAHGSLQSPAIDSATVPATTNWVVLDVSGNAVWRGQGESEWRAFELGEVLPPGCEIETGPDGQVKLVAGGDQLIVAPLGRLVLPEAEPGQDRHLRHERGHILMHVESREGRDVRINTPLLSLGIKGTTFEVEVGADENSVLVHDGEVHVTTPDRQEPVSLGAGEGLRQPAAPGAGATRFNLPESLTGPGDAQREVPSGTQSAAPQGQETTPAGTEAAGATAPAQSVSGQVRGERAQAPAPRGETSLSWLDEIASSWASVAIAGVALAILTIPVLVLLHNLREQWRGRTVTTGQRRRELVRG